MLHGHLIGQVFSENHSSLLENHTGLCVLFSTRL